MIDLSILCYDDESKVGSIVMPDFSHLFFCSTRDVRARKIERSFILSTSCLYSIEQCSRSAYDHLTIVSLFSLFFFFSTALDETMSEYFVCKNGRNVPWSSVCDGRNQCADGSDEQHCK